MKKLLLPIAVSVLALTACTTKEIVREVTPTTNTPNTQAPIVTNPPVNNPSYGDYQLFLNHVNSQSYAALTLPDSELMVAGDNVCSALDNGMSFSGMVTFLQNEVGYMTEDDATFLASVVAAAVVYLCPEYTAEMNSYLGTVS